MLFKFSKLIKVPNCESCLRLFLLSKAFISSPERRWRTRECTGHRKGMKKIIPDIKGAGTAECLKNQTPEGTYGQEL